MFGILISILLGVLGGLLTGLIPGLHVNTIAFFILSLSLTIDPLFLAVFIISVAVTHTIVDFIPSLYLGAPDPSSALSILPGHKLLLEGKGYKALLLTVAGGLVGSLFFVFSLPLLFYFIPFLYEKLKYLTGIILVGIIGFLLYNEKDENRLYAFLLVILVSILGFVASYLSASSLFLGFTGLFGISTLLYSLGNTTLPEQKDDNFNICLRETAKGSIIGVVSSVLLSIFPTIGASQAGILSQKLTKGNDRQFLISLGTINTIVAIMSILSLYFISRARSGAGIAIQEVTGIESVYHALLFVGAGLVAIGLSASITTILGKLLGKIVYSINYTLLSIGIVSLLSISSFFVSGIIGFVILSTATSLGLFTQSLGLKRSHLMAFIMVPMLLFIFGI